MPTLDLLAQHLVHQPLLLQHAQPLEAPTHHVDGVHAAAAARDVLHLQPLGLERLAQLLEDGALGVVEVLGRREDRGRRDGRR